LDQGEAIAINEIQKTVLLFGLACFLIGGVIGYCLQLLSSRGQLFNLRVRADQAATDLREARAAQSEAFERADNLQSELNAATKRIGELQGRLDAATKSASSVENGIDASKKLSDDCEELIAESRRILSTVQKRGRK
jgi:chromosome segregation ATPase